MVKLGKKVKKDRKPYCYGNCPTCSCDPRLFNSYTHSNGTGY